MSARIKKSTPESLPEEPVETFICTECNKEFANEKACYFNERPYCGECHEEYIIPCDRCGDDVHINDAIRDDNISLCPRCFENYYMRCYECNNIVHENSACYFESGDNSYCNDCYDELTEDEDTYLHDYSYKPDPIFYGKKSSRYFGVELEIDKGGKYSTRAKDLINSLNTDEKLIYIKTDGSLDDGMEIVTHPMSLDYHKHKMPWKHLLDTALGLGYKSHKTTTCGLHIHVNKLSLDKDFDKQDRCVGRILFIVERFWEELLRFSRRTETQINQWAKRYGYKDNPTELLNHAKKGISGRYACVNITNYHTIEFRMFRGTLKLNTIIAALQIVNEICNAAVFMSDEEVAALSWCGFVERINKEKNKELITYLKERRLYINEPINFEEDN